MYQDSINKLTNETTTQSDLKNLHETASTEARNHFKTGCYIVAESFVVTHRAKTEKEAAESIKEIEEAFVLTNRGEDFEVKVSTEDVRTFYHEEMTRKLKMGDDQIFMESTKLLEIHEKIKKVAVDRVVAQNPGLNEYQKNGLSLALEKSFVKYEEDNNMLLTSQKDRDPAIGIDLGTTYCCTAVFY